jgi:3-deoxy-D-manno-octulosonic-acid transferase
MNRLDPFYILAGVLASPLLLKKQRGGWRQRLGRVDGMLRTEPEVGPLEHRKPRVLLHAVSVGEVSALRTLVPILARDCTVIVATTTDTGLARAEALYKDIAEVVRYPLDFSWSVRRFLDTVRPDAVALVELEIWPNFVAECRDRGIPIGVINGRLSARSFKGYRRFRWFFRSSFATLAFAAVQDESYAKRFNAMGVPPDRVRVTGSMKWDNAPLSGGSPQLREKADAIAENMGIDRGAPLVVAGSTGPGEESLIHRACAGLGVQLLCAPRKPERFDEAADAMRGCVRRSVTESQGPPSTKADRFLLDTIGELGAAYTLADVVIVGRSFGDLHGSDPTEPIGLGKPTIIGPAVGDFESIVAAFEHAGGILCATRESLAATIRALLDDPGRARDVADAGLACVRENRGASERHAALIHAILASPETVS